MSEHLTAKTEAELPGAARARHTLLLDDDRTRITQWVFAPGDQTGWHEHVWDYVTVQQSGGALLLQGADGSEKHVDYEDGRTMSWTAPIRHNAVNISDVEVRVLEIEFKLGMPS
jgi:quercetin dioxygenase-like cupin family protein